MGKYVTLLFILAMVLSLAPCKGAESAVGNRQGTSSGTAAGATPTEIESNLDKEAPSPSETPADMSGNNSEASDGGKKILVVYFSATGTTRKMAEYAANAMGSDIYEIVPATPYTAADLNYNVGNCRANTEMKDPSCRPEINGSVTNMADYDIVFIGYPIWWGEAPRIISTFMESYDFSDKTIVTFSTSGSSGHNDRSIRELVSGVVWVTGARLKSNSSQSDVADWINGLGLGIALK